MKQLSAVGYSAACRIQRSCTVFIGPNILIEIRTWPSKKLHQVHLFAVTEILVTSYLNDKHKYKEKKIDV